jgi:hypothetical protein
VFRWKLRDQQINPFRGESVDSGVLHPEPVGLWFERLTTPSQIEGRGKGPCNNSEHKTIRKGNRIDSIKNLQKTPLKINVKLSEIIERVSGFNGMEFSFFKQLKQERIIYGRKTEASKRG